MYHFVLFIPNWLFATIQFTFKFMVTPPPPPPPPRCRWKQNFRYEYKINYEIKAECDLRSFWCGGWSGCLVYCVRFTSLIFCHNEPLNVLSVTTERYEFIMSTGLVSRYDYTLIILVVALVIYFNIKWLLSVLISMWMGLKRIHVVFYTHHCLLPLME